MSTFALLTVGLAAFAPLASAYTTPVGDSPSGNAIYEPGLNSVVTSGKAFTITWEPTTKGNVSLLLCKGPSTNCVITNTLADSIENSGSYAWTPSTDLAPSQPTGYGIELVVEGTGEYQYSTQFGLSNPSYKGSSSSSSSSSSAKSASASATASSAATSPTAVTVMKVAIDDDSTSDANSTSTASGISASSTAAATGISASSTAAAAGTAHSAVAANGTATSVRGTGVPLSGWSGYANATAIKPTGSMTVSSSLRTSTASGSASSSTPSAGAAAHIGASFGGLAVAAALAVFAL